MHPEVFPKVYQTGCNQTIYLQFDETVNTTVRLRIIGMEYYTVPHTPLYRIDELNRHPFRDTKHLGSGLYSLEYNFPQEQCYRLHIKVGETLLDNPEEIYAVYSDLFGMQVFKGDTHLHSCRSDGQGTPFEVAVNYRKAGFDFIALTDHHMMHPSVEAKVAAEKLTDQFTVIRAEEVHNRGMGYFHIVNLGGNFSVNDYIEENHRRADREVEQLKQQMEFPAEADPGACAWRKYIADKIHEGGGLAVMAHPFWIYGDEYHVQSADMIYSWQNGHFDALEVLAGNPQDGDNLATALWADLRATGIKIPVVGASDSHSFTDQDTLFNIHFTLVFAKDREEILPAIKKGLSVAVSRKTDTDFFVFGSFRLVKYARFLMDHYYPGYQKLTEQHGQALASADTEGAPALRNAEQNISEYKAKFFGR